MTDMNVGAHWNFSAFDAFSLSEPITAFNGGVGNNIGYVLLSISGISSELVMDLLFESADVATETYSIPRFLDLVEMEQGIVKIKVGQTSQSISNRMSKFINQTRTGLSLDTLSKHLIQLHSDSPDTESTLVPIIVLKYIAANTNCVEQTIQQVFEDNTGRCVVNDKLIRKNKRANKRTQWLPHPMPNYSMSFKY